MARINKEQQLHLDGMAHAFRVAKNEGLEALEQEIKRRGIEELPLNVSNKELTAIARIRSKEELMIIATAMAETMCGDMKMPPSIISDYLRKFNQKVDLYRNDKEALKKAQARLDSLYAFNEAVKKFNEEE
jgi:hypothetical protein